MPSLSAAPALVGGDPVVPLEVSKQTKNKFLREQVILRLSPNSGTPQQFALAADPVLGEANVFTAVRVGPDGQLYQLRTNLKTGASIARFSLGPA